MSDELKKY